jgi:hypothetical protein
VIYRVPFSVRLSFTHSDELQFFAIFLFALYCKILSFFYPIHLPTPLLQIILRTSRSSFSFLIFSFLSFSFSFLFFYLSLFSFPHAGDSYLSWRCKLDKKIGFLSTRYLILDVVIQKKICLDCTDGTHTLYLLGGRGTVLGVDGSVEVATGLKEAGRRRPAPSIPAGSTVMPPFSC